MPVRIPSRATAGGARVLFRTFTSTPRLATFHEPADSHYDVLKVRMEATEAEIKKSAPEQLSVMNAVRPLTLRTDPSMPSPNSITPTGIPQTPTPQSASSASRKLIPSSPRPQSAPPTTATSVTPTPTPTAVHTTTRLRARPAAARLQVCRAGARILRAVPSGDHLIASTRVVGMARTGRRGAPRMPRARGWGAQEWGAREARQAWGGWGLGRTLSTGPTRRILTSKGMRGLTESRMSERREDPGRQFLRLIRDRRLGLPAL